MPYRTALKRIQAESCSVPVKQKGLKQMRKRLKKKKGIIASSKARMWEQFWTGADLLQQKILNKGAGNKVSFELQVPGCTQYMIGKAQEGATQCLEFDHPVAYRAEKR